VNLDALIDLLSNPAAYPEATAPPRICQTHISVVFLTDRHAYKIKKPVNLGFLDFSTLAKRRHFCEEEVRLNRRLAPDVYLGVVPVTAAGVEAAGEPVEWAVKMVRLPEEATLQKRLLRGEVDAAILRRLAERLAAFHREARRGPEISACGRFDVVAGNARENFGQTQAAIGTTVYPAVYARVQELTDFGLKQNEPLIEARAAAGLPCETHGDLHLDHIYYFPERPPPDDLVIVDCIEFNERFRFADPVCDAAFVAMDLRFHGCRGLGWEFFKEYLQASQDLDSGALFHFYAAYRAVVRAKVEGIKALESEVPPEERDRALTRSRALWLLALTTLDWLDAPALILVAGLPGSGKSTLARHLCENGKRHLIQSDRVRKELAGNVTGSALYSWEWNERTYSECLRQMEQKMFEGKPVVVDANFREDAQRQRFLASAVRWGVPAILFLCQVGDEVARQRLLNRKGDISDADWAIRQGLADEWEPLGLLSRRFVLPLNAEEDPQGVFAQALRSLPGLAIWGTGNEPTSASAR
jgi:aminoglycoside phosphotransferase family enzyme/predicted kinase